MAYNYVKMLGDVLDHIDGTPDMTAIFFKNTEVAKWYKMNKARLAKEKQQPFKYARQAYSYLIKHEDIPGTDMSRVNAAKSFIAKSPSYSYHYSYHLGKRWPEGEAAIATNAEYANAYATDIIVGRWPEGEAAIAKNAYYSYSYARNILKGRFIECEAILATNAYYSSYYALDIIRGRFPLAEIGILESHNKDRYIKMLKSQGVNTQAILNDFNKKVKGKK